jgi:RNAse (barnase) inhibitor barstar
MIIGIIQMKIALIALVTLLLSFQVMASGSVLINGKEVKSHDHLHSLFAKQLNFPSNSGKSVDALYEALSSDLTGQTIIKIKSMSILKIKLGPDYMEGVIKAISDASEDNPKIVLLLE